MRPPESRFQINFKVLNSIIFIGLLTGMLSAALLWFKGLDRVITPIFWTSLALIGLRYFQQLRRSVMTRQRWIMLLAALAAVALVYLFPELFRPACGNVPRAFALRGCPKECVITVCTHWVPGPSAQCPKPGPGGGCCLSYVEECDKNCAPPPPPDQPPTITGTLFCGNWGLDGWCIGNESIDLSAIEPQGKEVLISGDVAGTPFSCPVANGSANCSVPLPEGTGIVNYTATSTTGKTDSDSTNYKLDSVSPLIDGSLNGSSGANGWYVTEVQISASAYDSNSGLNALETSIDGSAYATYTAPFTLTDGVHTLVLRATDSAGNVTETTQTVNVDTLTPTLDLSIAGTAGNNDWYISTVEVSASASDSNSGVNALEYDLDGAGWTTYTTPLTLMDGEHTMTFRVTDNAGNTTTGAQTFLVDTTLPKIAESLDGTEGANGWYKSTVQVSATGNDVDSGLVLLEVQVDGADWIPYSDPLQFDDGLHTYRFRAADNAGNIIQTATQQIQVDTTPPAIDLTALWELGQRGYFTIQDSGSGLSNVRIVIEDEDERYPKVAWDNRISSHKFSGQVDWDGRFKDGTLAPPNGEYYAWVKVTDQAGNEGRSAGQIIIPLTQYVEETILPSRKQQTAFISEIEEDESVVEPQAPRASIPEETSRLTTKTVSPVFSFGGKNNNLQPSDTQNGNASFNAGNASAAESSTSPSNILWGATAAAAVGAFTTELVRRKREEEEKKREAAQRQKSRTLSGFMQKIRAKKMAALEAEWAAQREQKRLTAKQALGEKMLNFKEDLLKLKDPPKKTVYVPPDTSWKQQDMENAAAAQTTITPPETESNWWDTTKAFVRDQIIQPVNTTVVQPYIKPAVERITEATTVVSAWVEENIYQPYVTPALENAKQNFSDNVAWVNENVYEPYVRPAAEKTIDEVTKAVEWVNENVYNPYVKPAVERAIQAINDGLAWADENIYQPYVKPAVEKIIQVINDSIAWFNKNIYQPYIQPALSSVYDKFYQPYVKPLLEKMKNNFMQYGSWININIYQPIFQPVVSDINQYIYQPYFKPQIDDLSDWWNETWEKYGEWVHGTLDTVGFIPGLGDIADGLNGLIYLGEGRYLEASISALAMIPIIGDLGKGGKWGIKAGKEILEEAVEKVSKEMLEEAFEDVIEDVAQDAAEKIASEFVQETLEVASERVIREIGEDVAEKTGRKIVEEVAEKSLQEISEKTTRNISKNIVEDSATTLSAIISRNASEQLIEKVTQKTLTNVSEETVRHVIGDVTGTVTALVKDFGTPAVKVMEAVDVQSARKLLSTLDDDVIEFVLEQGPEAVDALSKWSGTDLLAHGPELALRAKKDAEVLKDVNKLIKSGPLNPKKLSKEQRDLIKAIAENSTQYADQGQTVLGKWVDYGNGFSKYARETGSVHYNPHPDMWNLLGELGEQNRDEIAWLINEQVIQNGIVKDLPFEYTLGGIKRDNLIDEINGVDAIWTGASDDEIMDALKLDYVPIRMEELKVLYEAGYQISFDSINNSYVLVKP